jgi:hypothetical protein
LIPIRVPCRREWDDGTVASDRNSLIRTANMNALGILLSQLIDYAGIFPPASLSMRAAVRNYAQYARGGQAWALGRFILPAARLPEFHDASAEVAPEERRSWRVSLLGTPEEVGKVCEENSASSVPIVIDSMEAKAVSAHEIEQAAKHVPAGMAAYFEIPLSADLLSMASACAAAGVRAKFRTGGVTPNLIPRSEELVRAISICCKHGVPFKATAGLHHPVRSVHKLTYAEDAPSGTMHGFINVFLAAAVLWSGGSESDATATLRDDSANAFRFTESYACWNRFMLSTHQLRAARNQFAISFGSCSFEEPIEDLKRLSWL